MYIERNECKQWIVYIVRNTIKVSISYNLVILFVKYKLYLEDFKLLHVRVKNG